jgi:hypothetical protein
MAPLKADIGCSVCAASSAQLDLAALKVSVGALGRTAEPDKPVLARQWPLAPDDAGSVLKRHRAMMKLHELVAAPARLR